MSEQKTSFMMELDKWTDENVIFPLTLVLINSNDEAVGPVEDGIRKGIRAKVLESYRNGQAAGPRKDQSVKRKTYGV